MRGRFKPVLIIECALGGFAIGLFLVFIGATRYRLTDADKVRLCQSNLCAIYHALQQYRVDYDGKYPIYLTAGRGEKDYIGLYPAYIQDASVFICPADRTRGQSSHVGSIACSYVYSLSILNARDKEVMDNIYNVLIPRFGKDLRLVYCIHHANRSGRPPCLVLTTDGKARYFEPKRLGQDPQAALIEQWSERHTQKMREAIKRQGFWKPEY